MLPAKPAIGPALLRRHAKGPLKGPIEPGEVFAWEPDLPHARELCIVRRLYQNGGETWVEAWHMDYSKTHHNDEDRFREACVRTAFCRFPAEKPGLIGPPMPASMLQVLRHALRDVTKRDGTAS